MPAVSRIGEIALIDRLRRRLSPHTFGSAKRSLGGTIVGIGDDTAVLKGPGSQRWLFASDMLVEGVHFPPLVRRSRTTPRELAPRWIGWKALACNISDVAAMGGLPRFAVVSLGLPPKTPVRVVDEVYAGLSRCAKRFGMSIVGGDTTRSPVVVVDVAILGTAKASQVVLRNGARLGDQVFVTGRLGGSLASGRHATFLPRVAQAQWLVRRCKPHAMMDLSDGLASDLWQVARASHVRFRIDERAIPASRGCTVRQALMDGEDFELLFTLPSRLARRAPRAIEGVPVTRIGQVVARGAGVDMVGTNGRITQIIPKGFKHF